MRTRFSMKTEYGVRAIFELAASAPGRALQSAEIARRQRIPGPFLDQVLMTLRRAGLVRSIRGPRGGHLLNRPAAEIRLDEIIECLEGSDAQPADSLKPEDTFALLFSRLTEEADRAARKVYASHTLEELVRIGHSEPPVFHGIFKPVPGRGPVQA
jgi:Rrf2 family protein